MRSVYINNITSFLPNAPVGNEEMEDYIGLIGGQQDIKFYNKLIYYIL